MANEIFTIRSDKDTHLIGAITQNNQEIAALSLPSDIELNAISEFVVEGVSIQSKQNLQWDVFIWASSIADDADLNLDTFVDAISFPTNSGLSIANGAGTQFYYPPSDLDIKYRFGDPNDLKLYISLVNRSLVSKLAGVTGEVVVEVKCKTTN